MINSLKITNLRNVEYIEFISQFLAIILGFDPVVLKVKTEYDLLQLELKAMEASFKTRKDNPLTDELQNIDVKRDNCITGIVYELMSKNLHFDDKIKAAAIALSGVVNVYGSGIAQLNYNAETTTLRNLVEDLKKPENWTHCKTLGIDTWVLEMEKQNQLFEDTFINRNKQNAQNKTEPLEFIRLRANAKYDELKDMLNAQATVNKNMQIYKDCIKQVNNLIASYNTLLEKRRNKQNDDDNKDNNNEA